MALPARVPGHSPSSRHWLLWAPGASHTISVETNTSSVRKKKKGKEKNKQDVFGKPSWLRASLSRHPPRWQGSVSAGHCSRGLEPLQKSFFSSPQFSPSVIQLSALSLSVLYGSDQKKCQLTDRRPPTSHVSLKFLYYNF